MTTTSWNHSSRLGVAIAVCLLLVAVTVPVAAVSTAETDAPDSAAVGDEVSLTITLTELYDELEEWEMTGTTQLENPTWTVVYYDQTGSKVDQESFGGQTFDGANVAFADDVSEVEVQLTGEVPSVETYSYDPHQAFTAARLEQVPPGGGSNELVTAETEHFTSESQAARETMVSAESAIEAAGSPTDPSEKLDQAIQAYEGGDFELATTLAEEAQTNAEQAQNTQER
ncbi:MAG: hypothetical protein J07HB67_01133, partial [halophilic archaeon J07HB67]